VDQVFPQEQTQGACKVVLGEVNLGQPECVAIVVWECQFWLNIDFQYSHTAQSEDLITDVDRGFMLALVEGILAPWAQVFVHVFERCRVSDVIDHEPDKLVRVD
jgi:hypothetical protein